MRIANALLWRDAFRAIIQQSGLSANASPESRRVHRLVREQKEWYCEREKSRLSAHGGATDICTAGPREDMWYEAANIVPSCCYLAFHIERQLSHCAAYQADDCMPRPCGVRFDVVARRRGENRCCDIRQWQMPHQGYDPRHHWLRDMAAARRLDRSIPANGLRRIVRTHFSGRPAAGQGVCAARTRRVRHGSNRHGPRRRATLCMGKGP